MLVNIIIAPQISIGDEQKDLLSLGEVFKAVTKNF